MTEAIQDSPTALGRQRRVRQVSTTLTRADRLGELRVRLAIRRMKYTVEPGLYAVGNPDDNSVVLVSANYKMSFDALRSRLAGRDAWILVLDTDGINVWCAAGKGTFETDEIVRRVEAAGLSGVVSHRTLVLPQLGAPGVKAHEVKKRCGFAVKYGPVRAEDLPAFLDAGMKATEEMRRVRFGLWARIVLIPVELVTGAGYAIFTALCFFVLAGFWRGGYLSDLAIINGTRSAALVLLNYLAACVLGPVLLPWLPGRAFSAKGVGIGVAVAAIGYHTGLMGLWTDMLDVVAWLLMLPAVASFIVMNFTGASTFTSLSGVRAEMRIALRLQIIAVVSGLALWIVGRFV